jgi:hypothetical protein
MKSTFQRFYGSFLPTIFDQYRPTPIILGSLPP